MGSDTRRRSASPEPRRSRDDNDRRDRDRDRDRKRSGAESSSSRKARSRDDDKSKSHKSHSSRKRDGSDDEDDDGEDVGPKPLAEHDDIDPRIFDLGASAIGEDDFFQKAAEFKYWLRISRKKYLDEMSSKEARKYFEKFVRRWNGGELEDAFYKGEVRTVGSSAAAQTRHKWGFTSSKLTKAEQDMLEMTRDNVDTLTNENSRGAIEAREAERRAGKGKRMKERDGEAAREAENADRGIGTSANATATKDSGWASRPSSSHPSDAQYNREENAERERRARQGERRRENRDLREEMDELAPKATGREAFGERKKEVRAAHRSFANRREGDDGFDVDDGVLMGGAVDRSGRGADDYRSALEQRDRASSSRRGGRSNERPAGSRAERNPETGGPSSVMKQKEADTMAMFKAMAQQRFGAG